MARFPADWSPVIKVWVHRRGRKVLGPGRAELLGHIEKLRSIAAAAKQMDMSYRRAWGLVRDMNAAAGELLVAVSTGGPGGGGAALTAAGEAAIAAYRKLQAQVARLAK